MTARDDKRGALREKISELLRTLSIEDGDVDEVTDGLVMVIESTVKATLEAVQALASTPSHELQINAEGQAKSAALGAIRDAAPEAALGNPAPSAPSTTPRKPTAWMCEDQWGDYMFSLNEKHDRDHGGSWSKVTPLYADPLPDSALVLPLRIANMELQRSLETSHAAAIASDKAYCKLAAELETARSATPLFTLDTAERVCFYEQEFYVLSNFSAFRVNIDGVWFDTSEAAYHWHRFYPEQRRHRRAILAAVSAHEAFRYAQDHKADQRPDWDAIKCNVMKATLRAKADQHEYVRRKLLETGERELVENSWRDPYWGWGPNRDGLNMLGKLWMEIRADLRAADGSAQT